MSKVMEIQLLSESIILIKSPLSALSAGYFSPLTSSFTLTLSEYPIKIKITNGIKIFRAVYQRCQIDSFTLILSSMLGNYHIKAVMDAIRACS